MPSIKQFWKGHFTYQFETNDGILTRQDVQFEMELFFERNSFHGTTVDDETKGLFNKPITVNGFVENDLISFIVMYPYNYYYDPDLDKVVIDESNEYPGCEYQGEYNMAANKYIGIWQIVVDEFKEGAYQDDYYEELYTGTWEMMCI